MEPSPQSLPLAEVDYIYIRKRLCFKIPTMNDLSAKNPFFKSSRDFSPTASPVHHSFTPIAGTQIKGLRQSAVEASKPKQSTSGQVTQPFGHLNSITPDITASDAMEDQLTVSVADQKSNCSFGTDLLRQPSNPPPSSKITTLNLAVDLSEEDIKCENWETPEDDILSCVQFRQKNPDEGHTAYCSGGNIVRDSEKQRGGFSQDEAGFLKASNL